MRITISRDEALKFVPVLVNKFGVSAYIYAFEKPEDNPTNEHIHCHLEMDNYKKSTMSDFMKKHNLTGKYNCQLVRKTKMDNLIYILKNGDILGQQNMNADEVEEALNTTARINDEKKIPMKEQLLNEWNKQNSQRSYMGGIYVSFPQTKYELIMFIDAYHIERDYLPPTNTLKNQYAIYLLTKINNNKKQTKYYNETDKSNFYAIYCSLNNIRHDDDMPLDVINYRMRYDIQPKIKQRKHSISDTDEDIINYNCEFIN